MRMLEIAVVAVDAVVLLLTVFRVPSRWWQAASGMSSMRRWLRAEPVLLAVLLLTLLVHLVVEQHRFVMIPAYAVTVILACALLMCCSARCVEPPLTFLGASDPPCECWGVSRR